MSTPTITTTGAPLHAVDDPADRPERGRGRRVLDRAWGPVATVLFCFLIVGLFVPSYPKLSPFDETMHFDSIVKATRLHVVRPGDHLSLRAEQMQACRGVDFPFATAKCGLKSYPDAAIGGGGINTASVHPPTYYFVTALVAQPFTWVGFGLFDAARLVGALWLAGSLLLLMSAVRMLGASRTVAGAAAVIMACNPLVLLSAGTINNDIASVTATAAILWAVIAYSRGRLRWWWVAAIAFGSMWIKDTAVVPLVLGALLIIAASAWKPWRVHLRPVLIGIGALVVGCLVGGVLWDVIRSAITLPGAPAGPPAVALSTLFTATNVAKNYNAFLGTLTGPPIVAPLVHQSTPVLLNTLGLFAVASSLASVFRLGGHGERLIAAVGGAATLGILFGGYLLWLAIGIEQHSPFTGLNLRYGLCILPFAYASIATMVRGRGGSAIAVLLALVGSVDIVASLINHLA